MQAAVFLLLSATCVGAVLAMLFSRRPAHSALFLVLAFAALGGIFGLLDAPFLAAVQVLVYAGAVMVLFIFVIMTVDPRERASPEARPWFRPAAVLLSAGLLAGTAWAVLASEAAKGAARVPSASAAEIGRLLFSKRLYPFEVASLLILAALAASVIFSRRKDAR